MASGRRRTAFSGGETSKKTGEPLSEPMPALLERTPYDKRGNLKRHGEWYAEQGYVVAI